MQHKTQQSTDFFPDAIPFIMEGQVVAVDDPEQMGRVKVWVPSLDGEKYNIDALPWTNYASPLFGFTTAYPAGSSDQKNEAQSAYGFWAIPKIGAVVLIFCLNANPDQRYYFASKVLYHRNRSLPLGKNKNDSGETGPFGENKKKIQKLQPAYDNLRIQFSDKTDSPQAKTRGAYERQAAADSVADGYSANPADSSYLDPQTMCFVTPGRHAIIFQDDPKFARLRIKTAEGHQIIFDDANERIYVSTAKGNTWLELDQDGHMHVYASESISFNSKADINFHAGKNLNLYAESSVNIKANTGKLKLETGSDFHIKAIGSIFQEACKNFSTLAEAECIITGSSTVDIFSKGSLSITGTDAIGVKAGGNLNMKGSNINLNGPAPKVAKQAGCAERADNPPIIPLHEPWKRPATKTKRGPNWKE